MSREDPQLKIRIPPAMKAHLDAAAERNGRTLNAEIVHRLQLTIPEGAETPTGAEVMDAMREMKLRIEALNQRFESKKKKS